MRVSLMSYMDIIGLCSTCSHYLSCIKDKALYNGCDNKGRGEFCGCWDYLHACDNRDKKIRFKEDGKIKVFDTYDDDVLRVQREHLIGQTIFAYDKKGRKIYKPSVEICGDDMIIKYEKDTVYRQALSYSDFIIMLRLEGYCL